MNIPEILAFKFPGQQGISCRDEGDGWFITKFPDALPEPTPENLAAWELEFQDFIAAGGLKLQQAENMLNKPETLAIIEAVLELVQSAAPTSKTVGDVFDVAKQKLSARL